MQYCDVSDVLEIKKQTLKRHKGNLCEMINTSLTMHIRQSFNLPSAVNILLILIKSVFKKKSLKRCSRINKFIKSCLEPSNTHRANVRKGRSVTS